MRWPLHTVFVAAALTLAACGVSITRDASVPIPGWVPKKFILSARSAPQPRFEYPEIVFELDRDVCSDHRDVTGPSDCATGTRRSVLITGRDWRLGYQNLFSFEFLITPGLVYRGRGTGPAAGRASTLSIARWQAEDLPDRVLFDLKLDASNGVTFMGRTCAPPSSFGTWQRVYVRIRWSEHDTGFLEVRCGMTDIYSAPVVFARSNFPTARPLCLSGGACTRGTEAQPERFSMQLGLIADHATSGKVAPAVPRDGLSIRMRRLAERRLYVIFGRVETF